MKSRSITLKAPSVSSQKKPLLATLLLTVSLFLNGCSTTSVDLDEVQHSIDLSTAYLTDAVEDNGLFEYRINMNPQVSVTEKYNMLRHAGAIYSMATYYQLHPNEDLWKAIEATGSYLRDTSIGPVEGQEGLLAVWSDPEVNGTGDPMQAKLGGTGLGLVAMMSIEKIEPGFTPLEDLQALGRFMIFMQKEDGSFYSKYIPSEDGFDDWVSLYYPGEAALGLMMLYESDPSEQWLNSASKALEYLALSREGLETVPADHWALLATGKLLSLDTEHELPVSRELLINHAIQITESILAEQVTESDNPQYLGGFTWDGRTTPTATRLEGLQAVLTFLPEDQQELRTRIQMAVDQGMLFLLRAQVQEGEFAGAFPRAIQNIDESPDADDFNRRATEVRIDYVQHALSAMMQYLDLKK